MPLDLKRHYPLLYMLASIVLVYLNAFPGVFQYDDLNVIVKYPVVHNLDAWWQDVGRGMRPLLKLSYTLNWLADMGTVPFHLTNLFIHFVNSLLIWRLCGMLVRQHAGINKHAYIPLLSALLFALHPAATEVVTYVSGRSSSLMTLFYLSGFLAYERGRLEGNLWFYITVPLCMLLALATKETAVTFPAALMLWSWLRGESWRTVLKQQWVIWMWMLIAGAYFLWHDSYRAMIVNVLHFNTIYGNAATQLLALVYLLRQWFAPLWLNIDPDLPVLTDFAGLWPHALILLLCVAVIIFNLKKRRWLAFALMWFLLHLLPLYILLPRQDVANDRHLYLASWPLTIAVMALLAEMLDKRKFVVLSLSLLLSCAAMTISRNRDYHSEIAFWESTVKLSPDRARVHNNLGYAYMRAGRDDEARQALLEAIRLDPNLYIAKYNLHFLDVDK